MERKPVSVIAFCNPLLDIIGHVTLAILDDLGARPGTMNLVDFDRWEQVRKVLKNVETLPGGSGANTARGFAWCDRDRRFSAPVFCGAVGEDTTGRDYLKHLAAAGVKSGIAVKRDPSGASLIAVTPDGERTMFTHLGACRQFAEADVDFDQVASASVLHLTGYLWDTPNQRQVAEKAAVTAKTARVTVSLDLADPFAVNRYRKDFREFIPGQVDVLFGNREEIALLCGEEGSDEAVIARAASLAPTVVMKAGAKGAYVGEGGHVTLEPGLSVTVRDTTGAGDSFAAGFLYARLLGRPAAACARAGNRLAGMIVGVEGCHYGKIDYSLFAAG
jgi:sugar/nucleoside kinase (ribokinase family)